ncbi:hypothetical protein C1Y41_17345 [Pantoea sp. ICBG 1758]|uniref:hypothetical protein n=1 Tax=Pantoea sp. ICBG 1758 TaxID=2071682 RepID=UPI000CE3E25F|nr:hypothetical protein [Pantoea sp. ICBG 1758]PPC61692.1 hypothetical protein C1Y41_17345 [Pantoea sp. ICBG 1758]
MDELKKKFEVAEKAISVLTKASLGLGSAIFLFYCMMNGGFPDGLSLSDSLRILYIFTVFSAGTLVFYFFLMCLGLSICHLLFRLTGYSLIEQVLLRMSDTGYTSGQRMRSVRKGPSEFYRTGKRQRQFIHHVVFPPIATIFHSISMLTVILIITQIHHDKVLWYFRLVISAIGLAVWFVILDFNRQRRGQLKFVLPAENAVERAKKDIRTGNVTLSIVIPIAVTMLLGLFSDSAERTMKALGFRHDSATVYVKKEWSSVLTRHGVKGSEAELPPYALRYDNVTVALYSFGTSVTLQFHGDKELRAQTLRVPATEVLIDPLHSSEGSKAVASVN